jgi:hypothetical protein
MLPAWPSCWARWKVGPWPDAAVGAALPPLQPCRIFISQSHQSICSCWEVQLRSSLTDSALPPGDAVGRRAGLGLTAVWCALAGFYLTRLSSHLLFYWWSGGGVFAGRTKLSSKVE